MKETHQRASVHATNISSSLSIHSMYSLFTFLFFGVNWKQSFIILRSKPLIHLSHITNLSFGCRLTVCINDLTCTRTHKYLCMIWARLRNKCEVKWQKIGWRKSKLVINYPRYAFLMRNNTIQQWLDSFQKIQMIASNAIETNNNLIKFLCFVCSSISDDAPLLSQHLERKL